jgi:hypothetical protein
MCNVNQYVTLTSNKIVLLQDDRGFLDEHLYIEDDWLF